MNQYFLHSDYFPIFFYDNKQEREEKHVSSSIHEESDKEHLNEQNNLEEE